jgi:gluconokinase
MNPNSAQICTPIHRVVVMGVSGSGKTTFGQALAAELGIDFVEGDTLHSHHNVRSMAQGTPLTDADRLGWLQDIASQLANDSLHPRGAVVSCSALKLAYRDLIRAVVPSVRFVFLKGASHTIAKRLQARGLHFMPSSLLQSQFDTLEPPDADENPVTLDISLPLPVIVQEAVQQLQRPTAAAVSAVLPRADDHVLRTQDAP